MYIYYNLEKKDGKNAVLFVSREHYDAKRSVSGDPAFDKISELALAAGAVAIGPGLFGPKSGVAAADVIKGVRAAGNVVAANTRMHS